ncbi:MAG: YbgC/FadM family acyl-CoA thioesterase [Candidatus Berkiellales bacterium]
MIHHFPVQIYYEDTDAGGIVYHANYIKFMERARTTLLQEKGLSLVALIDTFGIQFVVRSIQINYQQPARLQQTLIVVTKLIDFNKASMTFSQDIYLDPQDVRTMICSGEVIIVCTNLQFKPCKIPEAVGKEFNA